MPRCRPSSGTRPKRIFERLGDEHGYGGGYDGPEDTMRVRRRQAREVFVPFVASGGPWPGGLWRSGGGDRRGGAEGSSVRDDGPAAKRRGVREGLSGETTEAFLDGHVSAFAFFGGVPRSILYDNTKLAVARVLGDGRRQRTRAFELTSHYLFEDRFGRPGKGNDKGKVGNLVGYARRNYLVPCHGRPSG